jgi:hypothetical protein
MNVKAKGKKQSKPKAAQTQKKAPPKAPEAKPAK